MPARFDELAAAGIATSAGSLDTYRGPAMRTNRMSAGSPAFQLRVAVLLQVGDWFQATLLALKAARFRSCMVEGTPLGTQGVRFRQDFR